MPAIARAKPAKKLGRSRTSPGERSRVSRAVKKGATEMMTDTLAARV